MPADLQTVILSPIKSVPSEQVKVQAEVKLKLARGWLHSIIPRSGAVRGWHGVTSVTTQHKTVFVTKGILQAFISLN